MRIVDERKRKSIKFNELEIGKVFFFEDADIGGDIPFFSIENVIHLDGDIFNAIDLTDGTVVTVKDNEKVIPYEAILTIK